MFKLPPANPHSHLSTRAPIRSDTEPDAGLWNSRVSGEAIRVSATVRKPPSMYAVVGCSECSALWVLEGDPETSECPRCGSRRPREKRRVFHRCEDADEAREVRGRLLAERRGEADAFAAVDSFADLESGLDAAGPDDETYLAESGLDPEAVEAAGERATTSRERQSREETVRAALRELDAPDAEAVAAYCRDHGVAGDDAEALLAKLRRAGEVTRRDGGYRLL